MSIDLNNLKKLNDTYGHNEGDHALVETAHALVKSRLPACYVYRVGCDEFAAICLGKKDEQVKQMTDAMYKAVEETGYSCAIGCSRWNSDKSFTEIYKEADDEMYSVKREMKELGKAPMRLK